MHPVIRFRTSRFDLALEPANPINPIPGASLLEWLRARVPAELAMSDPDAEDWGWYAYVDWQGRGYLIGACAFEDPGGCHEWTLQIDKMRSFKEKLLGRQRMSADDPCAAFFHGLIAADPAFVDVVLEPGS